MIVSFMYVLTVMIISERSKTELHEKASEDDRRERRIELGVYERGLMK